MDADGLVADRALLGRTSTAERVAGILRTRVSAGYFPPGTRLAEEDITEALGISRNTLREAFRLLTHERLLEHKLNRGVFVRVLDMADVLDLYRVRKHVECSVARTVTEPPPNLADIADAVRQGELSLGEQDWRGLGTANIRFHQEIVAVAGSPRLDELMRGVLAELRLVFHVMANPRWFHEPYLSRNRDILAALERGNGVEAEHLLAKYLDDAERQLVEAYTARRPA
ncbi:GntR family transcriptional regulator [Pseudonocardia sp. Cha107L01]|uniref:GntR family transcriptional regulator n=1 Tax=Pseudonocardia sp. Cha107L01 TaxID=3457576 RepID=UPI00403EDDDD